MSLLLRLTPCVALGALGAALACAPGDSAPPVIPSRVAPSGDAPLDTSALRAAVAPFGAVVAHRRGTGAGVVLAWKDNHGSIGVAQLMRELPLFELFTAAQLEQVHGTLAVLDAVGIEGVTVMVEGLGRRGFSEIPPMLPAIRADGPRLRAFLAAEPRPALRAFHEQAFQGEFVHPSVLHSLRFVPLLVASFERSGRPLALLQGADPDRREAIDEGMHARLLELIARAEVGALTASDVAAYSAWFEQRVRADFRSVVVTFGQRAKEHWQRGGKLIILNFGGAHFAAGAHSDTERMFGDMFDRDLPSDTFAELLVCEAKSHGALLERLDTLAVRERLPNSGIIVDPIRLEAFIRDAAR